MGCANSKVLEEGKHSEREEEIKKIETENNFPIADGHEKGFEEGEQPMS